jgi:hypothetical protein
MTRFLICGLAWVVMSNVAAGGSPVVVGRSAARRVGATQAARVGREFKVRGGRTVTLEGGRLRVRFASVASDSRCPADVDCVWAGNAELLIEVGARSGSGKKTLRLNTNASPERPGEGKYGRYTVKLLGLTPQPRAGRKIKAGEYTAALLVSLVFVD